MIHGHIVVRGERGEPMSRYIDIEWLKKKKRFDSKQQRHIVRMTDIYSAPSIDIVRCKECKYYIDYINMQFVNAPTLCGRLSTLDNYVAINADDFCSYGERSE